MNRKRKDIPKDVQSNNHFHHTPVKHGSQVTARIYRDKYTQGILAAVEDSKGRCYIGIKPVTGRTVVKYKDGGLDNKPVENIEEVQEKLDEYARQKDLMELDINL